MSTRLLLIDPDIAFVVSIKTALEKTGDFQVSISANGAAAEDALSRHRHDVAVVAFDVSDMDALELIVALRHVQGDLPVIMTPETEEQQERIRFMDVQGAIKRPYAARDLIPYVRSVLTRARSRPKSKNEFVPPQMPAAIRKLMNPADSPSPTELLDRVEREKLAKDLDQTLDVLEEFEAVENSRTRLLPDLDQQGFTPGSTVILPEQEDAGSTDVLEWSEADPTKRLESTRTLADEPAAYDQWQPADPNQPLQDPDTLDQLIAQHGWISKAHETKPLNAPPQELDTLSDSDFGEVLDSLSGTSDQDRQRSPDDRAFHEMVDAMRPEPRKGRNRLEDLLASIAADATRDGEPDTEPPADNPLDYVLDAIRRGKSLSSTPNTTPGSEMDDATIGDVIEGLFDPSFEGVLAALAGEEISEENYAEPTYTGEPARSESVEPRDDDLIGLDDMVSEEGPEWLREYEGLPATLPEQHGPTLEEPPINAEDSSHYPATAALSAVTGDDLFSLDDLLVQIEHQLPPSRSGKPQLKPLPSWEREAQQKEADQLATLFDRYGESLPETAPMNEAELSADTQPMAAHEPELEPELETELEAPFEPEPELELETELELEASFELELETELETEALFEPELELEMETELEAPFELELELELPEQMEEEDLAARLGPREERPAEAPEFEEDELAARLGVRGESSPVKEGQERVLSLSDLLSMADLPVEAAPDEYEQAAEEAVEEYEAEEYEDEEYEAELYAEEDRLVEVPAETAARMLSGEVDEEDALARIAIHLTQFSLESSAQATLISRPGRLLAKAGDLPERAMNRLFQIVDTAWESNASETDSLIRYITLPDAGDYLLYSSQVEDGMFLSMAFHANTPVRAIRRQARRLSESLEFVPEAPPAVEADIEPEAARTQTSRPTALKPPPELRAALAPPPETVEAEEEAPARPEGPYAAYTCLWIPRDPALELLGDYADELYNWIQDVAEENMWDLEALDVRPDYVALTISVPLKTLPDSVIRTLMNETADRSAMYYPDEVPSAAEFWAGGYYVVTPPRALTDREIARFITYQRQAQLG